MFMNFNNFANELDMCNNIINATSSRDYAVLAAFQLDGYYVSFKDTDTDDELLFVLRATGDGCAIYPQSAKYEGQYICFNKEGGFKQSIVEFADFIKLIENFFFEAE